MTLPFTDISEALSLLLDFLSTTKQYITTFQELLKN